MARDTQTLLTQYRLWVERTENPDPDWVSHYNDLRLVDACQDKIALSEQHSEHPLQIGIVGPTQAGKSTLVNLITHSNAAGINPRAGYTVHAQGFGLNVTETDISPIHTVLEPLQRVQASALDLTDFNAYVLDPINAGPNALVNNAVVWDSPDFDSIEAKGYRGAVFYTAALADVLILMVSKDKYGDKSVWDMLNLLVPLNKPILVVINKLSERDTQSVLQSFTERFNQHHPNVNLLPVVALPYVEEQRPFTSEELSSLKAGLTNATALSDRQSLQPALTQFIEDNWSAWIKPAENERDANTHWTNAIQNAVNEALSQYELRYLNDDSRNDVFNRALAELLDLLEIPGIAASLQKTREVVTWPARKLLGIGVKAVRGNVKQAPPEDLERDVLASINAHVLTSLQGIAADAQHDFPEQATWWQALSQELRSQRERISRDYEASTKQYQKDFNPQIEEAAQKLYQQLETQPALLNSLRAARVTTDAAAVALAVKSGGLAATDLLVAPAMLSVTTLLTESALGRYMSTVKSELKQQQSAQVRQQVIEGSLGNALRQLTQSMDQTELLGMKINEFKLP